MLDPIIAFFERVFHWIGRAIGMVIAWLVWPFLAFGRWYRRRGWLIKGPIGIGLILLVGFYLYFGWQTQRWTNFNPNYVEAYAFDKRGVDAGETAAGSSGRCAPSAIAEVAADLTDFNVNQNAWISSMLLYKLGLFGMRWDHTPFFDNKASFQRGVNQAVRRTAVELVDTLGRVRGTSQIDADLQSARGNIQFDESTWYFELSPFGPKTPTPTYYRDVIKDLRRFNARLAACEATFDARADNLLNFLDRVTSDIGSTSDILRGRIEQSNAGWFDVRADDRFWFAYGQLYGYYGVLSAARADFDGVFSERNLVRIWERTAEQLRAALGIQPFIISNGAEDGWIMPTHLATMGFYVLRVRSNLVEMRSILDR